MWALHHIHTKGTAVIRCFRSALFAALAAVSMASHANLIDKTVLNCSDALSITGTSMLDLRCTGDLSIFGEAGSVGVIQADQALSIWASGNLSLHDVRLSAPSISLSAEKSVSIDTSTQVDTGGGTLLVNTLGGIYVRRPSEILSDYPGYPGAVDLSPIVSLEHDIELARNQQYAQGGELSLSTSPVPEPATGWLMLMALPGIALASRARRKA